MDEEKRISEIKTEIVDSMTRVVENWGLTGVAGRVYGVLLFSNGPMSMDEISKASGYSVSSICQQIPLLENMGNVKRTKRPGSKKVYFEAEHDISRLLNKRIRHGLEHTTIPTIETLDKAIREYNNLKKKVEDPKLRGEVEDTLPKIEHMRDKIMEIKKFYTNILNISIEKLLKEEF